ncbi:MAG: polysaccharide biosynthesis C-terminal domain-containing protein [Lachnospiraceae bacterium]|nr:polysaccharide biosynthesis C-terminal domain-containing protein [Lachnospiraceae bacterium]
MDILKGNVKTMYLKFLAASFGSAMISAIYGVVDMAMVGQYQGPLGTAALAVVAPIWNIIYSLGILTGVGGSVLLSVSKGENNEKKANDYFTKAVIFTVILAAIVWIGIVFFDKEILTFFGADKELLPYTRAYVKPVKFAVPVFMFCKLITSFLLNDNAPGRATKATLAGGIFNVVGDYFFVFVLDMGIMGAGIATVMGACITLLVLMIHFVKPQNTLKLTKIENKGWDYLQIAKIGFPTFIVDCAMGFITILFNRQIGKYLGNDALAVYGVIVNISTIVQCCGYSVGQASQPLISRNYGAGLNDRVKAVVKYAFLTAVFFALAWTLAFMLAPLGFVKVFMKPTATVLAIAPAIMRTYGLSFLLLPVNIFAMYYYQSVMEAKKSIVISLIRGVFVSALMIEVLPLLSPGAIWFAMPVTELVCAGYCVVVRK